VEKRAAEGNDPHGGHRRICKGEIKK